jgi:hypothetical protein
MSNERTSDMTGPRLGTVAAHQPGQDAFKSVLSEDINWKPFAAFAPSVRLAVIVGQPSEAGPHHNQGPSTLRQQRRTVRPRDPELG